MNWKEASTVVKYSWGVFTPSNPRQSLLGYGTQEQAEAFKVHINESLKEYDNPNSLWNKDVWKTKPDEFVVIKLDQND